MKRTKSGRKNLGSILSSHFIRFALVPILVIEVALVILYFSINSYMTHQNIAHLEKETARSNTEILKNESETISRTLAEITRLAQIMQNEHEAIFRNPDIDKYKDSVKFSVAENGVFYKTNQTGSSLYYSSRTKIGEAERNKAIFTEEMDRSLMSLVDTNNNIVAAYFNSYDDMNRLYPFIGKVYEQYGSYIHMEDYNFYYLADQKHNPERKPVWTDAYLDPAGNGWMLSCIVPIYNGNKLEGVSGLDFTIKSFVRNLLDKDLPHGAKMFMVDEHGTILAMPKSIESILGLKELRDHVYEEAIKTTVSKPEEFNILKNESPFAEHFRDMMYMNKLSSDLYIDGSDYITLQQKVEETGWRLMVLVEKSVVFSSINSLKAMYKKIGFIAVLLMAIFYLLFFVILVRQAKVITSEIIEPIEELTDYTSVVGQGKMENIDVKVVDTKIAEIHSLNDNFAAMVSELKGRTEKLNNAELMKEAKEREALEYLDKSMKDSLTSLFNRNKIDRVFDGLLRYFDNNDEVFSIILLDIDHFKEINDTHGHNVGDNVLVEFARLLEFETRKSDVVGRYGGEEFIVIIRDDVAAAEKLAEKLRSNIEDYTFCIKSNLTSSFGVTEVVRGDDQKSLVGRADKALYAAKNNGRNRVEVA